jgi:hypothetical protein
MGWTEAEAAAASMEYVMELAADMALEAESPKAATHAATRGQPQPGETLRFISKRE